MSFLLYGATGYTGTLIAEMAVECGVRPILAGRNEEKLAPLASRLNLQYQAFLLEDRASLDAALGEVPLVLHCAGPFIRTARPMVEACLRMGTHYLDVTGEVEVFEQLAALDSQAREAGVMVMPGVGFDVVTSDCLAVYLKNQLPAATSLEMAIMLIGPISHGTATTMVENIGNGGAVRKAGQLIRVPAGWKTREVDFGRGMVEVVSVPWGDIATAYRSTGIPNIVVYAAMGKNGPRMLRWSRPLSGLLASRPVQAFFKRMIRRQPPGPNAEQRARGRSFVWGQVRDDSGREVTALLRCPEAYTLTALTALASVEKVIAGQAVSGFQTPAQAFGHDFILSFDGVTREDRN
ncbi:MAG: saccharopine dehydrogenase family protein [Rhodothermales bacterium]